LAFCIIFSFKYFDILFFDESYSNHSSWNQLCGVDGNWGFGHSRGRHCLFYGARYGITHFLSVDAYFFDNRPETGVKLNLVFLESGFTHRKDGNVRYGLLQVQFGEEFLFCTGPLPWGSEGGSDILMAD